MIPGHLRDRGRLMRVEKNDERTPETVAPHLSRPSPHPTGG
ncbi:hypothetical protein DAD186_09700 [Dermabacter vaginalis]|uniref:Uncharacterized protein n=1 Tax=Dermabacter vaginalis TaxID=1630135 RepID=A0A1B0ZHW9_9MICO|nr:hypothetical protein DAD186_09700 [Dermabacter vaginalis]